MGWELARWPSLFPGVEWTALNAMTSFSTSFPVPGAASYPSSVPLTRNFSWIEGRSFIPSHSTGYEWIFRIRVFLLLVHHEKYPLPHQKCIVLDTSDISRPRCAIVSKNSDRETSPNILQNISSLNEWILSVPKEKRKISHMENICLNGALRELVYRSVIISSHRNVHRLGIWIEFIVCSTNKFLFMLFFRQEISSLGIVWTMICTLDDLDWLFLSLNKKYCESFFI